MPCNPQNPKALNPEYICNERTNRWNLRRRLARNSATANTPTPAGGGGHEEVRMLKKWELLLLPQARLIRGRHAMRRGDLAQAIIRWRNGGVQAVNRQQQPQGPSPSFRRQCQEWEEKCPMDSTLEGDTWCSFPNDRSFIRLPDWSFCTTIEEVLSLLQSSLTNYDYTVGAPRLNLPTNPYNREYLPLDVYETILGQIRNMPRAKQKEIAKKYPVVALFLYNFQKPAYRASLEPRTWTTMASNIHRSTFLLNMLRDHENDIRNNGRRYGILYTIDQANRRLKWRWRQNSIPPSLL